MFCCWCTILHTHVCHCMLKRSWYCSIFFFFTVAVFMVVVYATQKIDRKRNIHLLNNPWRSYMLSQKRESQLFEILDTDIVIYGSMNLDKILTKKTILKRSLIIWIWWREFRRGKHSWAEDATGRKCTAKQILEKRLNM